MNNQNFLLQKTTCICEQITSVNMRPCEICGQQAYSPEIEKQIQKRKAKTEAQRQSFLKKYVGNKLPF